MSNNPRIVLIPESENLVDEFCQRLHGAKYSVRTVSPWVGLVEEIEQLADVIIVLVETDFVSAFERIKKLRDELYFRKPILLVYHSWQSLPDVSLGQFQIDCFIPIDAPQAVIEHELDAVLKNTATIEAHKLIIQDLFDYRKTVQTSLDEAAEYMQSLIPAPVDHPIRIAALLKPALSLGGDLPGFYMLDDNRLTFFIIDVTGHGIRSALLATSIYFVLQNKTLPGTDFGEPSQVMNGLNECFGGQGENSFFSLWYGVLEIDSLALKFSSAGFPSAQKLENGKTLQELESHNLLLGASQEYHYAQTETSLNRGDQIFVFSDGIFETCGPGGTLLGMDGFVPLLGQHASGTPGRNLSSLIERMSSMQSDGRFEDDVSIINLQI